MNSAEGFAIHCYGDGSDERHVSQPYILLSARVYSLRLC